MPEEYRNIYKICRKSAGFTQEAAAERLGISVESLRAYETGQRVPPDEVVETMSDLYNALHLIVRHVRERNAMYSRVVPEVPQCSVLEASAKPTNRIYAFADSHADRRLMQMAEDSKMRDAKDWANIAESLGASEQRRAADNLAAFCGGQANSYRKAMDALQQAKKKGPSRSDTATRA